MSNISATNETEQTVLSFREEPSFRTESSRTFHLGSGHYRTELYAEPIFFRNPDGELEHIDNRLVKTEKGLTNTAGSVRVSLEPGCSVAVTYDRHTLSYRLNETAAVMPEAVTSVFPYDTIDPSAPPTESTVRYAEILPGIDIDCTVTPMGVRESVIYKTREAVCPLSFAIRTEGLRLREEKDGSFVFVSDDEAVFVLPAPALLDADGVAESGSAQAAVTQTGEYEWLWTCEPDKAIAEQAAYPLILDPSVTTTKSASGLSINCISSSQPNTAYPITSNFKIGESITGKGKYWPFIRFSTLPDVPSSCYVTNATLTLTTAEAGNTPVIYLHQATDGTNQSAPTWNSHPAVDLDKPDNYKQPSSYANRKMETDITSMARDWYAGSNYGLLLRITSGGPVTFYGPQSSTSKPMATIDFFSLAGLEDYLPMESHSAGRAGTAYVGLYNGNLVVTHTETSMTGRKMPVSISKVYNSCYHGTNVLWQGHGWMLSVQQMLHKETLGSVVYYVYTDGDGTRHYFNSTVSPMKDDSGKDLTLTLNTSSSTAAITDKAGTVMTFTLPTAEFNNNYGNAGMLKNVKDSCGNTATFTWNNHHIPGNITDGAGRVTAFAGTSITDSITAPGRNAVVYTYAYNNLIRITHEDGKITYYTYDSSHLLTKIKNHDNSGLNIQYYTAREPYRVSRITYFDTSGTVYAGRAYDYGDMRTTVTDLIGSNLTEGKKLTYHFNDLGNVISVNDELGYGCFAGYTEGMPTNHPEYVSKMQRVVNNYLKNHNFLSTSTGWTYDAMDGSGSGAYATDQT